MQFDGRRERLAKDIRCNDRAVQIEEQRHDFLNRRRPRRASLLVIGRGRGCGFHVDTSYCWLTTLRTHVARALSHSVQQGSEAAFGLFFRESVSGWGDAATVRVPLNSRRGYLQCT